MSNLTMNQEFVSINNDVVTTTSKAVAEHFKKLHKDVLRKIDQLLSETPSEWYKRNFTPIHVESDLGQGRSRKDKAYEMTKDGFMLLVMGFTGKKAMQTKIAFIEAFNLMQDRLLGKTKDDQLSTVETRVPLKDAVNMMVAKTNQKYSDCWRMVHQYMNISTVEELTNQQIPEAVEYVHRICLSWQSSVDREDDLFAVALMVKGEIAHMQQRSILDHVQTLIGEAHIALGKMSKYNASVFDGLNESRFLLNIDKETKMLGREKGERDFRERYCSVT